MNGQQTTVIGVLPATFDFGAVFAPGTKVDAITPLNLYGPPRDGGNIVTMIGRMKPGVTLGQAVGEAARVAPTMCWNNKYPNTCGDYKDAVVPVPLKDYVSGRLRQSLMVLWWAVGMILLIACVNLSNLLLARATARSKEFAMRGALGARRGRIVRQLLTESLVLSAAGAVLGLLLAAVVVAWLADTGSDCAAALEHVAYRRRGAGMDSADCGIRRPCCLAWCPGCGWRAGNLQEALKDSGRGFERRAASTNGCARCWW